MNKNIRSIALIFGGLLLYNRLVAKTADVAIQYIADDLPKHPSKTYQHRSLSEISKVIIHHSSTSVGTPFSYAQYHISEHNWPGIGYHFVIQKDGSIFQTNDLETMSYHATNCNQKGIGICLTGNFDIEHPSSKQIDHLVLLIEYLNEVLNKNLAIDPHHSCKNTNCPGTNLDLEAIRNRVS